MKCDESSFECTQNVDEKKEKLQFESIDARNGVFFMTVKQTYKTEAGVTKEYSGVGIFGISFCFREDFLVIEGLFFMFMFI